MGRTAHGREQVNAEQEALYKHELLGGIFIGWFVKAIKSIPEAPEVL